MPHIKLAPLTENRIEESIDFIIQTIHKEVEPETSFNDLKIFFEEHHEFDDIKNYHTAYGSDNGVYYLLTDGKNIIGQGAVLKLDNKAAEIRRLYVSKPYRKTRASYLLIKKLIEYCQSQSIEFIRAEIFSEEKQKNVVALCFNKGGYRIPAYKSSESELFVEFNLKSMCL